MKWGPVSETVRPHWKRHEQARAPNPTPAPYCLGERPDRRQRGDPDQRRSVRRRVRRQLGDCQSACARHASARVCSTGCSCSAASSSWCSSCARRAASSRLRRLIAPRRRARHARVIGNRSSNFSPGPKRLHGVAEWLIGEIAQFRTCLWPCVGRWASGQEAGQPPKEETLLPCSRDRQPEAKPA